MFENVGTLYSCDCKTTNSRISGCRYSSIGHSDKTYSMPKEDKQDLG